MNDKPLWSPDPKTIDDLPIRHFARAAERIAGRALPDYDALHAWSVASPGDFWGLAWDAFGIVGEKGERKFAPGASMRGARFFPDATLNFAENLLRHRGRQTAIVFRGEDKVERRLTWRRARTRWCRGCSRRCARPASGPATGSRPCCRTCRRRSR